MDRGIWASVGAHVWPSMGMGIGGGWRLHCLVNRQDRGVWASVEVHIWLSVGMGIGGGWQLRRLVNR
jgi:hypothetical protein